MIAQFNKELIANLYLTIYTISSQQTANIGVWHDIKTFDRIISIQRIDFNKLLLMADTDIIC